MCFVRARMPNKGGTVVLGRTIRRKRHGEWLERHWLSPRRASYRLPKKLHRQHEHGRGNASTSVEAVGIVAINVCRHKNEASTANSGRKFEL